MNRIYLDTNVLLRFLLQDNDRLSNKANKLFREASEGKCDLLLTDVAIAEAVWVLTSVYKIDRKNVGEILGRLLDQQGIVCPNPESMKGALNRFRTNNCDFFDCYLAALAASSGNAVATFDSDFKKFKDVKIWKA